MMRHPYHAWDEARQPEMGHRPRQHHPQRTGAFLPGAFAEAPQRIHKLSVNLDGSPERGCVRSTSRSRCGVAASLRCCCDWLSAQSRSTDNAWMHRKRRSANLRR